MGGSFKKYKGIQGGGGLKSMSIERVYFLNGS